MSTLQYRGRSPDSDFSIVHKNYVDGRYNTVRVDQAYINSQISAVAGTLVNQNYVDAQDALRATKAAADAADASYVPADQRGVANGVAPIGSDGYIPSANLPALQTTRKPVFKGPDQVFLSGQRTVTTTSSKEYQVATMTITDPGFPYYPATFAYIRGGPLGAIQNPPRTMGTPNFGQVSILAADNTKYGWSLCGSRKVYAHHLVLPFADNTINPTTRPPVEGDLTLGLWVGLWGGTSYTFDSADLQFFTICYPAL